MATTVLKTDYQDAVLNTSVNTKRVFQQETVSSGITLTDVSSYSQTGDTYGSADINATNTVVNQHTTEMPHFTLSGSDLYITVGE